MALLGAALQQACSRAPEAPAAAPAALGTVRFQADWFPQTEHGGFYQALAKGFYQQAGITVTIAPGGPGLTPIQLIMGGFCDIAMAPSQEVVTTVSHGLPVVIVGVYMEHDPQGILVHEEDTIRDFKDLDGRTMMMPAESAFGTYLKKKYHIDFRIVPLNFGMGEFMADKRFAQMCFVTNEPYYVRKNGGHPRALLIADSGYDPYRCLFTTRKYLADHPAAVRAFVAASIRGWKDFMEGDPSPGKNLIAKANAQTDDAFMNFSIQAMRDYHLVSGHPELGERTGLMTRKRLEAQARILADLGITPTLIPVEQFATFDFLPDDLRADASR